MACFGDEWLDEDESGGGTFHHSDLGILRSSS